MIARSFSRGPILDSSGINLKTLLLLIASCIAGSFAAMAIAQEPANPGGDKPFRPAFNQLPSGDGVSSNANQPTADSQTKPQSNSTLPPGETQMATIRPEITRVTQSFNSLPNDAGQVWREYDILPYTSQITDNEHPEQAIVDWIVRQTGTDLWFNQPFGILSATRDKLFVYHTPEIHNDILPIVDRFVFSKGQTQALDLRLCTVGSPNWRESCYSVMQPIAVQTPGVEAWIISKENAAILLGQLGGRSDFKTHSGGRVLTSDGQSFSLERRQPKQFAQNVLWTPGQGAGYQPQLAQINEGYRIDFSCLSTVDGRNFEVYLNCAIDQIEKFNNVRVPIPNSPDRVQRVTLQIPQLVSWRLEERFRWPSDQVLLISCGVVATPDTAVENRPLGGLLDLNRSRADALLFIDYRGPETRAAHNQTSQQSNGDLVPIR